MRRLLTVAVVAATGLGASASPAVAHHTYGFYYDVCKRITIEGHVERIEWKAPHPLIELEVDDGATYLVEWSALPNLVRQGLKADTLKGGDRLAVTGSLLKPLALIDPARRWMVSDRGPNTISALVQMRRASDGWMWSTPEGAALPKDCR